MKWHLISAAALGLALASPAMAAPDGGATATTASRVGTGLVQLAQRRPADRDRERNRTPRQDRSRDRNRPPQGPAVHRPSVHRPGSRPSGMHPPQRFDWGHYRPGHAPPNWRDHRFDRLPWMHNYRAERRYRWHRYDRPSGWYYRRWVFGTILPAIFWTQNYWIDSYWEFGLPNPPYGYVWVRYGDDALLVNVQTGYILQVRYGLFY